MHLVSVLEVFQKGRRFDLAYLVFSKFRIVHVFVPVLLNAPFRSCGECLRQAMLAKLSKVQYMSDGSNGHGMVK